MHDAAGERTAFQGRSSTRLILPSWSIVLILGATSVLFGGCAYTGNFRDYVHNGFKVGPEYCKPAAPVADQWIDSYDERVQSEFFDDREWWTVFNDPKMTELVYGAYQQNLPLRIAGLRVLQARAQRDLAAGTLFPQSQGGFGSYTRQTLSRELFPGNLPGSPRAASTWQTGLSAAWELDLWGKFRRNIESADANLDAQIEDYDGILVSLIAETASTYVQYRVLQKQLEFARANVKIQEGSLNIAQAKLTAGAEGTTELDVTQAQTNLYNTKRSIPPLENQLRITNNALCVLLGIPPRDLSAELGPGQIPLAPKTVAVGVPANLLRRRPDVLSAERLAAAQSARIGVAAADWFPSVQIAGSLGYGAGRANNLFTSQAFTGAITPQFNVPILNYGRILSNVRIEDALFQQAAINYQQTVLGANAEAENAINGFLKAQETLVETEAAVVAAQKSVNTAVLQYERGFTDFNRVFNVQLILVQEQNILAQVQGAIPQNLIAIYRALGGGWQIRNGGMPPASTAQLESMPNTAPPGPDSALAPVGPKPVVESQPLPAPVDGAN